MILIPSQDKKIIQTNNGNIFGNIWSSLNLDLISNRGRIRTTRMIKTTDSHEFDPAIGYNSDLGCPVGFKYFSGAWWAVAGSKVHSATYSKNAFTADATSGTPTTCSSDTADIELFNGNMYVTTQTTLYKFTGSVWSTISVGSLNTNTSHIMTQYGDRLYITDLGSKIYSINTSDTLATSSTYTLTFTNTNENVITFIKAGSNRIWVGTVNTLGGKGNIYEWDGVSTQVTRTYKLESGGALSCVIKDDIPYVMDSNGRLLVYTGGSFKEITRLPVEDLLLTKAISSSINDRWIHPNGMTLIDGRINILINNLNGDNDGTINENLPSGVWEYDENIGLYHKYSISYTPTGTTTVTDYGQNRLSRVGAIADAKITSKVSGANGRLLAGATFYTNASSTANGVFIDNTVDDTQKYSYFVTTWIDSTNLKDSWNNYYLKFKQFLDSSDKIIVKYRTLETTSQEVSITWTSISTFTTSTSILGKEGYEVEVIQGTGSGKTAHITSIDWNNTVYTAHLDDTFTGVTTGTAKVRIQKWTKLNEITGQTVESFKGSINKISERIQLKVCMQFTGKDELHQLIIINNPHSKLE